MADVFVSYSRRDAAFVTALVGRLEAAGCTAWLDQQGIPPSAEWMREILGAIESADCFVYVVSPDAVASEVCALELRHALDNHKRILPVLRRPAAPGTLAPEIDRLQWVECREDATLDHAAAQLVDAIRTDPETLHLHTRVLTRAVQWRDRRRDGSLLLRGTELATAEAWLRSGAASPAPTDLQRELVRASRTAADRRRRTALGLAAVTVALLATLGVVTLRERGVSAERALVGLAGQTASQALAQLERAYDLSLLLAVGAHRVRPTVDTAAALQRVLLHRPHLAQALRGATARAIALRFDAAGRRLVAGLGDSAVVAWDLETGAFERVLDPVADGYVDAFALDGALTRAASGGGHQRDVTVRSLPDGRRVAHVPARDWFTIQALAFSPVDAGLLASANGGGSTGVSIWDLTRAAAGADPDRFGPLVAGGGVAAIDFSADGGRLAAGGWFSGVELWDVATGARAARMELDGARATALAFDPGGRLVLAAGDRGVLLVDPARPDAPPIALEKPEGAVRSVAASPDGRWLAAGLEAGRTVAWDRRTEGAPPIVLEGLDTYVDALAFGAGSGLLASADYREGIAVWELGSIERFGRLLGTHEHDDTVQPVRAVAVAPDGSTVASGGWDRTVRVWPLARDAPPATLRGHAADVYALAFAPQGGTLVSVESWMLPTARGVAHAIRWDLSSRPPRAVSPLPVQPVGFDAELRALPAIRDHAVPVALGVAGTRLARVEVVQDPRAPNGARPVVEVSDLGGSTVTLATAHTHDVTALALSADGGIVATAGADARVEVWDVGRAERLAGIDGAGTRACRAAALDGTASLLAVGCDREVRLYDLRDGGVAERARLVGHGADVTAVAVAPQGDRLAAGDAAGSWALWDVESGRMIGRPFAPEARARATTLHALAFAPDGRSVVTGDAAGRVILWDVDVERWVRSACRAANRDLTAAEWERHLPGRAYAAYCTPLRSAAAQ